MTRTFLVDRRKRSVFFARTIEFVRRKRGDAGHRSWRGDWHGRRGFRFSRANENVVEIIAQLSTQIEKRTLRTFALETVAIRANVINIAAFLRRIFVMTARFILAIDRQFLFGRSRSGGRGFLGRRFLTGARDDVLIR